MIFGQVGGSSFDPIRSNTCGSRRDDSSVATSVGLSVIYTSRSTGEAGDRRGDRADRHEIFLAVIYHSVTQS